jgi:hypothetical protein
MYVERRNIDKTKIGKLDKYSATTDTQEQVILYDVGILSAKEPICNLCYVIFLVFACNKQ